MHLPNKPVDELEIADIQRLIDLEIPEDKFIEYKEQLHLEKKEERKEFLYDITSFANALGGEIIYGIEEERDKDGKPTGIPKKIKGIEIENLDKLKLLLVDLLRERVDGKLAGISHKFIKLNEGNKYALVFRIPMSLKAPHMAANKFYTRAENRKALMDVREIRMAFDRTTGLKERAEKFIDDRMEQVKSKVILSAKSKGGYIVGHFVPLIREEYQLDIIDQKVIDRLREVRLTFYSDGSNSKFTYEGFKIYAGVDDWEGEYTLFFRDSAIEFYYEGILKKIEDGEVIFPREVDEYLIKYFDRIRKLYEDKIFNLPFIYSLSLLNIAGAKMRPYNTIFQRDKDEIKEDSLHFKLFVDDLSKDSATILKPLFDMVSNSFGLARSFNYTEDGVFSPPG